METQREKRNEYEGDFLNDIGVGVNRVLFGITWLIEGSLIGIIVITLLALIFG
jgi:hypothetical protein